MPRGPVPKRDDQRIRRNKPDIETDTVTAIGVVGIPDLGMTDPHPMVVDFYEALRNSAQTKYYEPSDWQFARWTMNWMDHQLKTSKPSAMILQQINGCLTEMLVSEGARRRVRLEIDREQTTAVVFDVAEEFRKRMAA